MKRIPKHIKKLDIIATLFDWLFVVLSILITLTLFRTLEIPDNLTTVIITEHEVYGLTLSTGEVNRWISIMFGYLIVFLPTAFINTKRLRSKDLVEIDEWTYRTQFLHMFMSFFTLNIFSAALRLFIGNSIKEIHTGMDFKASVKDLKKSFLSLFQKETYKKIKEKRERRKLLSDSQQDLDRLTKTDFINSIARIVATYGFLTFTAIFIFIPFYWMLLSALKTYTELSTTLNPRFFIGLSEMQWVNFKIALENYDFSLYIWNTIFVGIASTIGTIFTTILAAFAFARLDFKGRDFIFSLLLMTMMIPGELYTITNYQTVIQLGWYDTFIALIVPFMTSVFYIFFLRQTFKQIPDSLYRAAQVDGCSDFKYLTRVMVPIAKPTIITITILSSIGAWDAFIWPQLVTPSRRLWLISVALRREPFNISGTDITIYNLQLAATALVTVPLIIIFFALKKYIMAGVGRSGIKG